mmetsp:Transcript_23229/g.38195  ORF Transcript_23229/g.38195 Transcript_23229/m.38195 type:complete len:983 (-) Transcript_23229:121-3069(-)
MSNRKLQGEIDRTLKQVQEGVELFDQIWNKVYSAQNANQKEKYEGDLKKQIKKLQRYRDQIKSWLTSNEIKDKRPLTEARKIIETEMERFKVCEKETKTKAYSKEGLGQQPKADPHAKAKGEVRGWIQEYLDALQKQLEAFEADIDQLKATKTKNTKKAEITRCEQLEHVAERHKHHQKRLELVLRLMENDSISPAQITDNIKDGVQYYVENHTETDFIEDEGLYDGLNLDTLLGPDMDNDDSNSDVGTISNDSQDDGESGHGPSSVASGRSLSLSESTASSVAPAPTSNLPPAAPSALLPTTASASAPIQISSNSSLALRRDVNIKPTSTPAAAPVIAAALSSPPRKAPPILLYSRVTAAPAASATTPRDASALKPIEVPGGSPVASSIPLSAAAIVAGLPKPSPRGEPTANGLTAPSTPAPSGPIGDLSPPTSTPRTAAAAVASGLTRTLSNSSATGPAPPPPLSTPTGPTAAQRVSGNFSSLPLQSPSAASSPSQPATTPMQILKPQQPPSEDSPPPAISQHPNAPSLTPLQIPTPTQHHPAFALHSHGPSAHTPSSSGPSAPTVSSASLPLSTPTGADSKPTSAVATPLSSPLASPSMSRSAPGPLMSVPSPSLPPASPPMLSPPPSASASSSSSASNALHNPQPPSDNINKPLQSPHHMPSTPSAQSPLHPSLSLSQPPSQSQSNDYSTSGSGALSSLQPQGQGQGLDKQPMSQQAQAQSNMSQQQAAQAQSSMSDAMSMSLGSSQQQQQISTSQPQTSSMHATLDSMGLSLLGIGPGVGVGVESMLEDDDVDTLNAETFGVSDMLSGPGSLADLSLSTHDMFQSQDVQDDHTFSFNLQMLDSSYRTMPEPSDSERPKQYVPRNPYPTPACFPQGPAPVFEDPAIFEKFDTDTLFFIFYYQQGTYQQYLAAKELKKQSWRYHKKYLTWFQRHEEPKVTTEEYEQGTYVYFDYETGWCQRIKTEFTFEYGYLEDELNV